ncbi:preprotein translocase subunit SecY [Candidatus Woesearchaeota archaeon]|nr:preprotein translocase subunit SecY [Candidatus Woesearchaeota archaeon]
MVDFKSLLSNLPEVKRPLQKNIGFKEKLKWTLIMLVAFFVLSLIPLYGLGQNSLQQFEQLSIILGATFGSLLSLGIGPLVTASIVLQLLQGSGIVKFDTTTHEGRAFFQGLQKVLGVFFIIFEGAVYVLMGGLAPNAALAPGSYRTMQLMLIGQLLVGGLLVMFMDEVVSKWGFGSGISLFIVAGVALQIVVRAFSPLTSIGTWALGTGGDPVGQVWVFFKSIMSGNLDTAFFAAAAIIATIIVFIISVYAQSMKVEIPLSFGRIRGHGIRWPLKFLYTSNIPVILMAALVANIQLWASLLESWGRPILGTFTGNVPSSGVVAWLYGPDIVRTLYYSFTSGVFEWRIFMQALAYGGFFVLGSIIFSIFWVQTSGMSAQTQSKQIMASGLQIPGFRRDPRVIEQLLSRYIMPLTVMGGAAIGLLAASADLLGALSRGTGILLAVMIVYQLYEHIAQEHMMDMHPALRKIMGGNE